MWKVPGIELEGAAVAPRVHLHMLQTISENQLNYLRALTRQLNYLRALTRPQRQHLLPPARRFFRDKKTYVFMRMLSANVCFFFSKEAEWDL